MALRTRWCGGLGRITLTGAALALAVTATPANALDFSSLNPLNWFSGGDAPPKPSATTLPYAITFKLAEGAKGSETLAYLKDASTLYKLRQDAPPDGEVLAQRAGADLGPMIDALWAAGYFNGKVTIDVAGARLDALHPQPAGLARAAERYRNKAPVPITVSAEPGPLFTIRTARLIQTGSAVPVPDRILDLPPGTTATSANLRAAQTRVIDYLRAQSHPLAKVKGLDPVVDHLARTMDIDLHVDPGPLAGIGDVAVTVNGDIPPAVIRSFIYLEPGEPYSPRKIEDTRKSVAKVPAVGSVRIREAQSLDPFGNLPLAMDVTERPKHLIGFAASYSTVEGPAFKTYWEHRNLFGGAERLRLEGSVFYAPRIDGTTIKSIGDFTRADLGAKFAFHFEKPALAGSRNDLLVDGVATRERIGDNSLGGYTARYANLTGAIRHRFSDTFSVQAGLEGERGQTSDALGQIDYTLAGLPLALKYDSTDNLLDPTRGVRLTAGVTPYAAFGGDANNFVQSKLAASTYYAIDEEAHYVLAARIGFGSLLGAGLSSIPANHRFYAGGSGSVRGYAFRSLSPVAANGQIIGGRSQLDGSLEARIRLTNTIGIVPFLDAGSAFRSSYPDFKEKIAYAAGIGLRYYTPIGPIRLDVATPLNPRHSDKPLALYISIGQAF